MTSKETESRGRMLVSKEQQRYVQIDANKVSRGSFHTKEKFWLTKQVENFIRESFDFGFSGCLDPFAGAGDLLSTCKDNFLCDVKGFDIAGGKWPINDSLLNIPYFNNFFIVTNPPYLTKYSARRKRVFDEISKYFDLYARIDLYQIALDRCLESYSRIVAIIPETFINSNYPKCHVESITILETNPFHDTETPVCVVCMDTARLDGEKNAKVYVDSRYCTTLGELEYVRNSPSPKIYMQFNDPNGSIALKAIDGGDKHDRIKFMRSDQFDYSPEKIKVSSRLMTYISIPSLNLSDLDLLIERANFELENIRKKSFDLILSPFKGNNKVGLRRRRLDYAMARKILSRALSEL